MADPYSLYFARQTPYVGASHGIAVAGQTFDYYIGPSGSDSNQGTVGSPWAITAVNTKQGTYAGKRVGILDGTYNVTNTTGLGPTDQKNMLAIAAGTDAAHPSVVGAVNPRQAILNGIGTGTDTIIGVIGPDGASSYVELHDLVVHNQTWTLSYSFAPGITVGSLGTAPPQMTGIVYSGCEMYGLNSSVHGSNDNTCPIFLQGTIGTIIRNCKFHDITTFSNSNLGDAAGIIMFGCGNTQIINCEFYNANTGIYHKSQHNYGTKVQYCYFHDLLGYSCYGFGNDDARGTISIDHNVFDLASQTGGAAFVYFDFGLSQFWNAIEGDVFNNTCVYGPSNVLGGIAVDNNPANSSGSVNTKNYNNVFYRTVDLGSGSGDNMLDAAGLLVLDYNCYYTNGHFRCGQDPALSSTTYTTMGAWQTYVQASLANAENNSITADPQFVGSGVGPLKYQLGGGSPCVNAGRTGGTSGGSAVNMGAYDGTGSVGANF